MNKTATIFGRKVSYDHVVDDDGYDIITQWYPRDDATVIDGVEYEVGNDAPMPVVYGVRKQLVSIREQAGTESVYTYYDHIDQEFVEDVPVPPEAYSNGETAYVPPSQAAMNENQSWHADLYRRNIKIPQEEPAPGTDMSGYNIRPVLVDTPYTGVDPHGNADAGTNGHQPH